MSEDMAGVAQKISAGIRLDDEEWAELLSTRDLISLGMAADAARRRRHGDRTTFVQTVEVPVVANATLGSVPEQAREIRLTGRPETTVMAVEVVETLVSVGGGLPVTGFNLTELFELSGRDSDRLVQVLVSLREAGLGLVGEVWAEGPLPAESAFTVLREGGMSAARLTLGESTGDEALSLIRRIASWSDAGSVCRCLAPLPRSLASPPTTGYGDLRQVALARLLVDNIESIQVDWSSCGPKLAQVALTFGADDVDAVASEGPDERGWRRSPGEEIRRNITAAGFIPMPRDGCFKAVKS